jgi:D-glycero-beta-D-manno-heptose 1-phosphate adenylyltransferase
MMPQIADWRKPGLARGNRRHGDTPQAVDSRQLFLLKCGRTHRGQETGFLENGPFVEPMPHPPFGPLGPAATLKSVGRFYSRAELLVECQRWKREGKTVVFTNGCYDLLHPGHIRLLEQARSLGDVLILALNSDASTRRAKGPDRPLIAEQERAELASALEAVDAVTVFDEDTPRELVALVLPDFLVKGADWSHFVAGREEVEAAGGKVLTVALEPGYSTTNIVERILSQP